MAGRSRAGRLARSSCGQEAGDRLSPNCPASSVRAQASRKGRAITPISEPPARSDIDLTGRMHAGPRDLHVVIAYGGAYSLGDIRVTAIIVAWMSATSLRSAPSAMP